MRETTFRLLESHRKYMNADILWISDFKIPLSTPELIRKMQEYRKADTRFYGMQIGIGEHEWASFFNHIYRVEYTSNRRY